jgi:peptidoglycan hydrolase CwlO-like protein
MAAFHLGDDDKLINTANAQGVALAAAKGLYEKLKQDEASLRHKDAEIAQLKSQFAAMAKQLSARMARLEQQGVQDHLQSVASIERPNPMNKTAN